MVTRVPLHLLLLMTVVPSSLQASVTGANLSESRLLKGAMCRYEGREYPAGAKVPTDEKCLSCQCGERGGAPMCRLQVCPELPVPPPRGCVLVHRRGECCQRLICENTMDSFDIHGRHSLSKIAADDVEISVSADNGCVVNGTRYAEGSATSSSTLCEYCYCVRGGQRCVRPQCEMPLQGCKPRYRSLSCCPVSYDCNEYNTDASTTSTTITPVRPSGCVVDGQHHNEGAQVHDLADACERCYCLRGAIRCIKLECAPPLMGCSPVFAPGRCCPVQYNCSKIITEPIYHERQKSDISVLLQLADERLSSAELRQHREMTEDSAAHSITESTTAGESTDTEDTELTSPQPQIKLNENNTDTSITSQDENKSEEEITTLKTNNNETLISNIEENNLIESRTEPNTIDEGNNNTTVEDNTTTFHTTEVPTEEIVTTNNDIQTTIQDTTLDTISDEISTNVVPDITEILTTIIPLSSSTSPHVLADRVDNLEELIQDTTIAPQDVSVAVTSTTITPTTLPPIIEALLHAKNKDEVSENEYGESLPPSLPNITMIPFLPEDAVVDKKKESYTSTESGGAVYSGAVQSQGFSPPASFVGGFLPRQPPLLDETPLFYPTSPQPDVGDILTAPQASMPPIISLTTPSPESGNMDSITVESTITLANPSATRDVPLASHIRVTSGPRACVSPDGREVPHGELLASPGPCEVCRCDRGTVLCHEETACSEKTVVQDRVDIDTQRFTTSSSKSVPALPALTAPENKIVEEDNSLSFDSVLDFLFTHGASTAAPFKFTSPPTTATTPLKRPRPIRPTPQEPPPSPLPAAMAGILKLAGCNIYGRMYRVGRIITELSGPCRECRCTELGVQCRALHC